MITALRPLFLALVTVLTVLVTQAMGKDIDVDAVIQFLKSANRSQREEVLAFVSFMKVAHAAEACEKFRVAIDGFEIHGDDAKRKIDSMFDSAFAAIDAAEGDHARKGANLAFDLAKGIGGDGRNPWYLRAGMRVIYVGVCERM